MNNTNNYPHYRNNTVRQFPKVSSPLAAFMVAPGYVYDQATGLVKPAPSNASN